MESAQGLLSAQEAPGLMGGVRGMGSAQESPLPMELVGGVRGMVSAQEAGKGVGMGVVFAQQHPQSYDWMVDEKFLPSTTAGLVNVPLEPLETKSEVHSTLDLLDERGRKPMGGKMEVFVRLREPLTGRDQEVCEEQWLVFQESIAAKSAVPMPKLTSPTRKQGGAAGGGASANYSLLSPVKVESTTSVAALKFEFSLVSSAIKGGHRDGQTVQKGKLVRCGQSHGSVIAIIASPFHSKTGHFAKCELGCHISDSHLVLPIKSLHQDQNSGKNRGL